MDQFIKDFCIEIREPYLDFEIIKMVQYITENGNTMQKMDGEFIKIEVRGIDMRESGRKTGSGGMVGRVH